jgi:hypothetical protein
MVINSVRFKLERAGLVLDAGKAILRIEKFS